MYTLQILSPLLIPEQGTQIQTAIEKSRKAKHLQIIVLYSDHNEMEPTANIYCYC